METLMNCKGKFKWSDFSQIKNSDDLENYIKYTNSNKTDKYQQSRAYNHSGFYHYSKLKNIEKILDSKSFLLFNPGDSNDPIEKEIENKKHKFMMCFSTGINENIPLWYLYGGVNGQGGHLSLTKSQIYDIINNGEYSLVEVKNRQNVGNDENIPLSPKDFKCTMQDVVYYKDNDEYVTLKYNTMTNNEKIFCNDFIEFKNRNKDFIKSLVWYYEKETRILIEINDSIISKLSKDKKYAIKLYFGNLTNTYKNIKLVLAPEALEKEEIIKSNRYPAISQFIFDTSNIVNSQFKDQVCMNLCSDCDIKKDVCIKCKHNKEELTNV